MIHVAYIFSEYQTGAIAGHSFESIPWFSKTDFFEKKKKIHCSGPNIFLKLLWISFTI